MVRATVHLNDKTVLSVKRLEVDDVPAVISAELRRILDGAKDKYAELENEDRLPIEIGIEKEP